MHRFFTLLLSILLSVITLQVFADEPSSGEMSQEEAEYYAWATEFVSSLNKQTGTVTLPNKVASLNLGDEYYYLSPEDAERVLVEAWGNPPDDTHLGMIFPAQYSPLDAGAWGVLIEYSEEGYVDDSDARDIDYDDLLEDMQADTREASEYRTQQGYETIELVGWAAKPYYDATQHKLHWAKELKFGNDPDHTLNYNLRVLGRKGVLSLNFIADMSQLQEIEGSLDSVMQVAHFDPGYRYDEFNPDVDKVAAYGIGALVAGKVLAKTGLLAAGLLLLKKFWFVIVAGFYGIAKLFRRK
ncbi:hypothetical protein BTA51_05980 [Hahella sp. CCB-MM4]|uniref:DUF2167 domain-containing protein n=1 Tax=Hahella sp. (strain CCB-MM4) TaxID=1926491 RepID=UPI000B9A268D|nr:DUF2167 domain-containing protein [Hahella sp. CCB-MM4]OZG74545.1 hypothetical protein BTA51_05980 [Hahella sp. CCB-MM4]